MTTRQSSDALTTHLRLLSVLESGLPDGVGGADQPEPYTVPVVFSRQVSRDERSRIEDPGTARLVAAEAGIDETDPVLRLVVSDRRLLVENTTLAQLRDGLAAALAAMLRNLAVDLESERSGRDAAAEARVLDARERADAVHAVVEAISFE